MDLKDEPAGVPASNGVTLDPVRVQNPGEPGRQAKPGAEVGATDVDACGDAPTSCPKSRP